MINKKMFNTKTQLTKINYKNAPNIHNAFICILMDNIKGKNRANRQLKIILQSTLFYICVDPVNAIHYVLIDSFFLFVFGFLFYW